MCGRFVVAGGWDDIAALYEVQEAASVMPEPSWNVAPTDPIGIVLDSAKSQTRRLEQARWGLIPSWAKDRSAGARQFNARVETASSKSSFAASVVSRRAIIPATGYYEWKKTETGKQPYFVQDADGMPLAFAALYSWWNDPAADQTTPERWVLSATILTADSVGRMTDLHDRVPLILQPDDIDVWLDPSVAGDDTLLQSVVQAYPAVVDQLDLYPVGHAVGSVRNNGPELILPISVSDE